MSRRFLKNLLPSRSKPLDLSDPMVSPSLVAKLTHKQLEEHTPKSQPVHSFSGVKWQRVKPPTFKGGLGVDETAKISNLRVLTWNIDYMAPFPQARLASALSYLQTLVEGIPASTAVIICFQELRQDMPINFDRLEKSFDPQIADDLRQIASAAWIQERFFVTDLTTDHWRCGYNSVTLIDKRLGVVSVARLPFVSEYQREALLLDIAVAPFGGLAECRAGNRPSILRLFNVHLDSMAGKPPMRPIQWKACARYLQDVSDGVVAGILVGDCNANQNYDLTQAEENGFKDAYLEMGGKEGDPQGHTWGPQSKGSRFPHKRMDKVCFWQRDELEADQRLLELNGFEKIGVGIKIEDESISAKLAEQGWLDFVTDHYGLMADFKVGEAWSLSM